MIAAKAPPHAASGDIVATLRNFMIAQALPLWSKAGWDARRGGFVEQLSADGVPDREAPRRVRVQARQIYCFATAARLGWFADGRRLAQDGLQYMWDHARSPDGRPGYVHRLTPEGAVASDLRDTYDHAFVLLALAAVEALAPDAAVRDEIARVLDFLDDALGSPHGGYLEGVPHAPPRRQNPHMHLFESMLALYAATGDGAFLQRAATLHALFARAWFDHDTHTLGEFFSDDWQRIEGPSAEVEPGHQAEWVWLLGQYERQSGRSTRMHRNLLLASALRYADPATGCLVDEGDCDGNIVRSTRRCWPQTEIAKAFIAQVEGGDAAAADQARAALARLHAHYLDHPVRGGWYDRFDAEGRSLVATIPASTMYHILCAVAEADRVLPQSA